MSTISDLKEQAVTDTPLVLIDCALANGQTEHWSTHAVTVNGTAYAARVMGHSAFDIQTASDQGVDGSPTITVTLANADSHFSEIEQTCGFKGAKVTVSLVFYDLRNGAALTDAAVVFQGVANPPAEIREATLRLTAMNRMSLQRVLLPQIRIQRRCPWEFPATLEQRTEAMDGGVNGAYSRYYRCGYSPDVPGGTGNLNDGVPYTSCGYTSEDCQARGMWTRFGGLEYLPPSITVRAYGKDWTTSAMPPNQGQYNDFVPMVYGTAWYEPPVVFARNDGNYTRMEVLLGIGEISGVLTVLVNDYEIPLGQTGANMSATGWYNLPTLGGRDGAFDLNFTDGSGQPAGDPYGSMAYLSVVVPNQINNGTHMPRVKVLIEGLNIPVWAADGTYVGYQLSSNPAWILLDMLRRIGWVMDEIDLTSFTAAAAYCDQMVAGVDLNGNAIELARFGCNLVLRNRRSAGDVVRGVRNAARLYLTYGPGGVLQLEVEGPAATVYDFGDGTNGISGILRRASGEPSVTVTARSISDTPNDLTVEFQDSLNGYQQDSYEMTDPDDIGLTGQIVTGTLYALGIANFDQAGRLLKFNLDKAIQGNTYIEFETSVKGFGIRPGDLITITYTKEGFSQQPFRVLKISPATNYRTCTISAQIHDDAWYADDNGQSTSGSGVALQSGAGVGVPHPLAGDTTDANGVAQFGVTEGAWSAADGTEQIQVTVSFVAPGPVVAGGPGIPLVSLAATLGTSGTLAAGIYYYAVSACDATGAESALSFSVLAEVVEDGSSVTLTGLSFTAAASTFNVYRGSSPAQFMQIASSQPVAAQFTDAGLTPLPILPPDANFDHANFYWRRELVPETEATAYAAALVGNRSLDMAANAYTGMTARITRGPGAGQEATITGNDGTTLTISPPWETEPGAGSYFTVSEAGWTFGAMTKSSPVTFAIPNRPGETVEISGRAANVNDQECAAGISPVTRWQIGGAGISDSDVPLAPYFGLNAGASGGTVELSGISFTSLTNTETISSATFTLHYWDELQGRPATTLATAMGAGDGTLTLNAAGPGTAGSILQIDGEVLEVTAVSNGGTEYAVTRGVHGSQAVAHNAGAVVYHLLEQTGIAAFPAQFFGSPYCGSWSLAVTLPDVRVASAELFATNQKGNSPTTGISMTQFDGGGLRTLSGGQYTIQVEGYLAVDAMAAPALSVEASHSVRDVYALLGSSADAVVSLNLNVNGALYCALQFAAGQTTTESAIDGSTLPPLEMGSQLTLAVTAVGQTYPGADLTVVIRL